MPEHVPGIYALGAVAQKEVPWGLEATALSEQWSKYILGGSRICGGFEDDGAAWPDMRGQGAG